MLGFLGFFPLCWIPVASAAPLPLPPFAPMTPIGFAPPGNMTPNRGDMTPN